MTRKCFLSLGNGCLGFGEAAADNPFLFMTILRRNGGGAT